MTPARDPAYLAAFAAALLLALGLELGAPGSFAWLLGPLPAVPTVLALGLAGALALSRIETGRAPAPWGRLVLLGLALAVPPVLIDLALTFPETLNVPLPRALAFYPVAGFLALALFHLVPLGVIALILRRRALPLWAYAPAALAEPVFQAAFSGGATLRGGLVLLHVAVFGACELWVLRRYGFGPMIALRLAFYAGWHLGWGWLRLRLLFPA